MKPTGPRRWILAGGIVALALCCERVEGQYRVNEDGRALDANTRIGSGGYNESNPRGFGGLVTGNQIVTGNVTGGREFRFGTRTILGPDGVPRTVSMQPYTDSREFRGSVAGQGMDQFIKYSSGAPAAYQGPTMPNQVQAFYGSRLAEPPPPGFTQMGYTGTYIDRSVGQDQRPESGMWGSSFLYTPGTGELLMTGPVDPQTNQPTLLTASPLQGIRPWRPGQLPDWSLLPNESVPRSPMDRLRMDGRTIQQMREELLKAAGEGSSKDGGGADQTGKDPSGSGNLAKPLPTPFEAPQDSSLTGKPLDSMVNVAVTTGQGQTDQSIGSRLTVPPVQQSSQYAELQRRLDRYYTARLQTDEDRNREFLRQLRAKEAAEKARASKEPTEAAPPKGAAQEGVTTPEYTKMREALLKSSMGVPQGPQTQPGVKPQPIQVVSLAEGVKAAGFAKVLRTAEDLMRQGKYLSALAQYTLAERVAPNNSLVWLGTAYAELAGGYFRRAEMHLRGALAIDPALLMGVYDLKGLIGQERLEALVRDLKETAKTQSKDPGPVFLLAYLAYNTGSPQSAALYLDEAEKRAGDKAEFYKVVRLHWVLPGDQSSGVQGGVQVMALSDALKQYEEGNVVSATLGSDELTGEFRNAVTVKGGKQVKRFRAALPAGAERGPLGRWLEERRKGAELKIEAGGPAAQPGQ